MPRLGEARASLAAALLHRVVADQGRDGGELDAHHADIGELTALRGKQLTNFRAAGKDDDEGLIPPVKLSLEQALEFIDDDELVEVTPKQIRLRKKFRTENDRKRASRAA